MVMTRSRSKALMSVKRTTRASTAVTEACIAEANKQMGGRSSRYKSRRRLFIPIPSILWSLRFRSLLLKPLVIPKPVEIQAPLCDAHKRWRVMSDDEKAPWVVKAARKELEDDVAVDVPCYGERAHSFF
ncbi:hypothetical protein BVRB_001960 [Beta vulgaris subsp. vulgaris]|uniref:Uncharacterized protein n=1 Tax=Beta vulgaris subsp. vulgaris TaxID=3555 RepID=A0A0J8B8J1_BETVV|nr:hypothetical protein BVRB_001960 [Beta vulgaris subsp. vulgaris]